MATPVEVPKLGNTVEECIVAKWWKRKGDPVWTGDVDADIETDKTTFEVQAPVGGTLLETFYDEGAMVPVFTNLFVIGEPGESIDVFRPLGGDHSLTVVTLKPAPEPPAEPRVSASPAFSRRARRFAAEHNIHLDSIVGSGPRGRVLAED